MKYEETLVIVRCLDEVGVPKYDFYFSNAPRETALKEFARVALADYEVHNWRGCHHHQVLSLLATWFLVRESHRGKNHTPAMTVPQIRDGLTMLLRAASACNTPTTIARNKTRRLIRYELARFYHCKARNRLPPLRINQRQ